MVDGTGLGYRIVARLAGRGRADVYAAVDRAGRSALLYVSELVPEGFLDALERLRAVSLLLDEVPRVLDGGLGGSFCWVAVERCDGPSLRALLDDRSRDLGPSWALSQVAEFAEVLRTAHASAIFHGGLCPEEIVLFGDGSFQLAGLGIAQLFGLDAAATAHRAPEQLATPATLDERTDVYALGLVLYELLGRRRPFAGGAPEELAGRVVREVPPAIETIVPLPPPVAGVVKRAIEKDPGARYRDMTELIVALHAAIEGWCRWQAELERGMEPGAGSGVRGPRPASEGARSRHPAPLSPTPSGPPTLPSGVTGRSTGVSEDGQGQHTPPFVDSADREEQRAPRLTTSTDREEQHAPLPATSAVLPGTSAVLPEVPPLLVPEPPPAAPQPAPTPAPPASPVASRELAAPPLAQAEAAPAAPGPRRGRRRIALAAGALALAAAAALFAWSQLVLTRTACVPAVARLPHPRALILDPANPSPERPPTTPAPRDPPPRTAPVPPRARPETTGRVPASGRPFEEDELQPPCGADWYTCGAHWPGARSTTFH